MMDSILVLFTICVAIIVPPSSTSKLVFDLKTKDAYIKFREEPIPQGIFYYHHNGKEKITSRTKSFIDELDLFLMEERRFMKFATINCKAMDLDVIDICKEKGNRKYFAFKPNAEKKRFSLRQLNNADSLVALMINFVYEEELSIISDMHEWNALQNEMKGKKNILLMYISALGNQGDFAFKMNFLRNGVENSDIEYAYTQNNDLAVQLQGTLVYAKCSDVAADFEGSCPKASTNSEEFYRVAETIESFVQLQNIPNVVKYNKKAVKELSTYKSISILFLFVESDEQLDMATKMAETVTEKYSALGIKSVIIDRRTDSAVLSKEYGITSSTILPTAMLKFTSNRNSKDEDEDEDDERSSSKSHTVFEPLTPDEDLTEVALSKFIENIQTRKDDYFKSVADVFYIDCIKSKDWKDFSTIKRDTLIAFCSSRDSACISFNQEFRRLVRTMYTGGLIDLDYVYVEESPDRRLEKMDLPSIAMVIKGKVENFNGGQDGQSMLSWINGLLKMDLHLPPYSGTDLLYLPPQSNLNENGEIQQGDNENLLALQEDEVSLFTTTLRNSRLFEDENTLQLTDETFGKTINTTELLLTFFVTPDADDVSYLIQPLIQSINMEFDKASNVRVAVVNCESEYLVCQSVHTYPLVRFYSKGKLLSTYNGLLDKKNIMKALKLHQQPHLEELSPDSLMNYRQPSVGLSIFGWFASENEDFHIYKKVANDYRGLAQFAYAFGEDASKMLPEVPESTLLSASVGGEKSRSFNGGSNQFSELGMREFLKTAAIPKFGQLNMENFPGYKATGKPLLILFASGKKVKDSVSWKIITRVVKDDSLENQVFFTWMDTDNDINKDIRRSYLGTRKERNADIVIVNHTKGEVYHYSGPQDDVEACSQEVAMWIRQCASGEVTAKSHLKVMKWKPLREGFDFLKLIDNNQIRFGLSQEDWQKQRDQDREGEKHEPYETIQKARLGSKPPVEKRKEEDAVLYGGEELSEKERADAESEEEYIPTETIDLGPNSILSEGMPKEEL